MNKLLIGFCLGMFAAISGTATMAAGDTIQALLVPVTFEKNGKPLEVKEDYGVLNYNGHVYVPIRFAAENLNAVVGYDEDRQKVILKNQSSQDVFDKKYNDVTVGDLIVVKEGDHTKVSGRLQMFRPFIQSNTVVAQLNFFNAHGELIGEAPFRGEDFGTEPNSFEAVGAGHFDDYATVELDVQWVNSRKIVADPDPNEPEVALGSILELDWNRIDKIELQSGPKTILVQKGAQFDQLIQHLKAVKVRKSVDPSIPVGYLYAIHMYVGDVRYTYITNLHLYNNQQHNYGKFVPNETTKALDSYVESILD